MAVKIPLKKYIQRAKQYDAIIRRHDAGVVVEDEWGRSQYFESHTNAFQYAVNNFGSIFVKKGTYNISQIFIDNKQDFILSFEPGSKFNVVDENAQIFDHPNFPWKTMPTIIIRNSKNIHIEGVKIVDTGVLRGNGIHRDGITIVNSENVTIKNVITENTAGNGIRVMSTGTYDVTNPDASQLYTKHIHIKNCIINGTKSYLSENVGGFGIEIEWSYDVIVESCTVKDTEESALRTHYSRSVKFVNNTVPNWIYGDGIDIYRSDHVVASANKIETTNIRSAIGIYDYCRNIIIENNDLVIPADFPIWFNSKPSDIMNATKDVFIVNNRMKGGIRISHGHLINVIISGNSMSEKIYIDPQTDSPIHDIAIENNIITSSGEAIIILSGGKYVIRNNKMLNRVYARRVDKLIIESNEFTSDGTTYANAVYLDGEVRYMRFRDNYVHDITHASIVVRVGSGLNRNGILEIINNTFERAGLSGRIPAVIDIDPNMADHVQIYNNIFRQNNAYASIKLRSPGIIMYNDVDIRIAYDPNVVLVKFNRGYMTENSGVATIPSGSTRATVEHGLATAPTKVLLTPYTNIRVWVENITSTSFDVVTDTSLTTDVQVAWYAEV